MTWCPPVYRQQLATVRCTPKDKSTTTYPCPKKYDRIRGRRRAPKPASRRQPSFLEGVANRGIAKVGSRGTVYYGSLSAHASWTVRIIQRQQQQPMSEARVTSEETRTGAAALDIDDMGVGPLLKGPVSEWAARRSEPWYLLLCYANYKWKASPRCSTFGA